MASVAPGVVADSEPFDGFALGVFLPEERSSRSAKSDVIISPGGTIHTVGSRSLKFVQ